MRLLLRKVMYYFQMISEHDDMDKVSRVYMALMDEFLTHSEEIALKRENQEGNRNRHCLPFTATYVQ